MNYKDLLKKEAMSPVRLAEVPREHAVSLPLPTKRWGVPGFACFASPALRSPGKPLSQSPPDRWWVVDARNGHLLLFALTTAQPFAVGASWGTVTLPPQTRSLDEMRQDRARLEDLLSEQATQFFRGERGDSSARQKLREALERHVPEALLPQYRALAPDFHEWLAN